MWNSDCKPNHTHQGLHLVSFDLPVLHIIKFSKINERQVLDEMLKVKKVIRIPEFPTLSTEFLNDEQVRGLPAQGNKSRLRLEINLIDAVYRFSTFQFCHFHTCLHGDIAPNQIGWATLGVLSELGLTKTSSNGGQ